MLTAALVFSSRSGATRDVFPDLTPQRAAELIRPAVACPDLLFEVVSVHRVESLPRSVRVALLKLTSGGTAWAFFRWPIGDPGAWERWDGASDPPGAWSLEGFVNVGTALATDRFALDPRVKQAMEAIRAIATAVEGWAVEHNEYPAGTLEELHHVLVPAHARRLRLIDPWGEPYLFQVDATKKQHYLVASPGADRRYQYSAWELAEIARGAHPTWRNRKSFETDLVMMDGQFVSYVEPFVSFPTTRLTCPPWPSNEKRP